MNAEPNMLEFSLGEQVRILSGPFSQFTGGVRAIDMERRQVELEVTLLGAGKRVEAFFLDVEKL